MKEVSSDSILDVVDKDSVSDKVKIISINNELDKNKRDKENNIDKKNENGEKINKSSDEDKDNSENISKNSDSVKVKISKKNKFVSNIKSIFPIVLTKNLTMPYYSSGHYHFLTYSLDGSISGVNSGMFIPPIQYLDGLDFYIRLCNFSEIPTVFKELDTSEIRIHDYIKKVVIYESKTVHYFVLDFLNVEIKLTYFVPDDIPGVVIDFRIKDLSISDEDFAKLSKTKKLRLKKDFSRKLSNYEIIIKPKIVFNYLFHENPNKTYKIWNNHGVIKAKSLFDKNLRLAFRSTSELLLESSKGSREKLVSVFKNFKLFITESLTTKSSLRDDLLKLIKEERKRILRKKQRINSYLYLNSTLEMSDKDLENSFYFAKYSIRQLRHHKPYLGEGFFAGIPHFPEFFSRDTFWSIPGILMTGDFENVKYALNVFTRYQSKFDTETKSKGKIPHEIWLMGEPNYYTSDSTLLYIYALYHYYIWTNDKAFIKTLKNNILLAYEYIKKQMRYYFIINDKLGFLKGTTWMDSYNRSEVSIEMQGLLVKVLEYFSIFGKILKLDDLVKESDDLMQHAKSALENFWNGNYYSDRRKKSKTFDNTITVNPFFLVYLGLVPEDRIDAMIDVATKKELVSNMGLRSRAKKLRSYISGSYHKGSIWPFTNALATIGILKSNRLEFAQKLLEPYKSYFNRFVPTYIPECVNGNTYTINIKGTKFSKDDKDTHFNCYLQLWSASTYVQLIVEGILGISPKPPRTVFVSPKLPDSISEISIKNLRILNGKINVFVKRDEFGGLIINAESVEGNLILKTVS